MDRFDNGLITVLQGALTDLAKARAAFRPRLLVQEVGTVRTISSGIATVSGLPGIGYDELIKFPDDLYGIAINLDEDEIGIILLGECNHVSAGAEVRRTGRVMDVPLGDAMIGRVVNPLGQPLDEKGPIISSQRSSIERDAPPIIDRAPVTVPLQTGIKVIDALVPIGRGQRELILGDRQTGKTAIAVDTIINQRQADVLCVYCAIGQRASSVAQVVARFNQTGAMDHTVVVVTEGDDPPGLKYVAPYAATTIAEYFVDQGRDVLIVYDDLTQHARAYRELSLLLRRPPGREAFPGDIFYIHARLLERATHLGEHLGGGSLTALPIIETDAQNISAYLPTNLISITDGQLYLSPNLFELGVLPAIDVHKSVSRVGGKAQLPAYNAVTGALKLSYAQFQELETFTRFGTRLDDQTRQIIQHGQRIRACFKQPQFQSVPVQEQIGLLLALTERVLDDVPLERLAEAEQAVRLATRQLPPKVFEHLTALDDLKPQDRDVILAAAKEAVSHLQ